MKDQSWRLAHFRVAADDINYRRFFNINDLAGIRIELRPEVQVTHRKRWTLLSTLRTDLVLRGIPWTLVILRDRRMPNALNIDLRNRCSVALVWLAALLLAFAPESLDYSAMLASGALASLGSVVYLNRDFYSWLERRRGTRFALQSIAAHLLHFFVCGLCFLSGVAVFATALALSRPFPVSVFTARRRLPAAVEFPSYASGD